ATAPRRSPGDSIEPPRELPLALFEHWLVPFPLRPVWVCKQAREMLLDQFAHHLQCRGVGFGFQPGDPIAIHRGLGECILVGIPRPFQALTMEFGGQRAEPGQLAGEARRSPGRLTRRGQFSLQLPSGVLEKLETPVSDSGLGAGAEPRESIREMAPEVVTQPIVPGPGARARDKRALP